MRDKEAMAAVFAALTGADPKEIYRRLQQLPTPEEIWPAQVDGIALVAALPKEAPAKINGPAITEALENQNVEPRSVH